MNAAMAQDFIDPHQHASVICRLFTDSVFVLQSVGAMARKRAADQTSQPRKPSVTARRAVLREFVRYAMGDPALSVWEVGFVHSMKHLADRVDGPLPSQKQKILIQQIYDKLRAIEAGSGTGDDDLDDAPEADDADDSRRWIDDDEIVDRMMRHYSR